MMEWPIITKDTPIEEVMRIHRQIWSIVISNLRARPSTFTDPNAFSALSYLYQRYFKPTTPYPSNCALCAYISANPNLDCEHCPAKWTPNGNHVFYFDAIYCVRCFDGEYETFSDLIMQGEYEEAIVVAEKIRDIPLKEEYLNGNG